MLKPSAIELIQTIESTLDSVVRPSAKGTAEQSALATVGHLLRHVALRIENEGQILQDDIAVLQPLLAKLHDYIAGFDGPAACESVGAIARALEQPVRNATIYPSLKHMAEHSTRLRQGLQVALAFLQSVRRREQGNAHYEALRGEIRAYLGEQVRREGELIHPAFENRGPRR